MKPAMKPEFVFAFSFLAGLMLSALFCAFLWAVA